MKKHKPQGTGADRAWDRRGTLGFVPREGRAGPAAVPSVDLELGPGSVMDVRKRRRPWSPSVHNTSVTSHLFL